MTTTNLTTADAPSRTNLRAVRLGLAAVMIAIEVLAANAAAATGVRADITAQRLACQCGRGVGQKFRATIREADAICQVTRAFVDLDVVHVDGKVDPSSDIKTINAELILADLQTLEKAVPRLEKEAKGKRTEKSLLDAAVAAQAVLEQGTTLCRGCDPHRFPARLHQGRGRLVRRPGGPRVDGCGQGEGQAADRGQRVRDGGRRRGAMPTWRVLAPLPAPSSTKCSSR